MEKYDLITSGVPAFLPQIHLDQHRFYASVSAILLFLCYTLLYKSLSDFRDCAVLLFKEFQVEKCLSWWKITSDGGVFRVRLDF